MNSEAARQLLENPLFIDAFETVESALIDEIKESAIIDSETRDKAGMMLSCLSQVQSMIKDHIDTARLDADEKTEST